MDRSLRYHRANWLLPLLVLAVPASLLLSVSSGVMAIPSYTSLQSFAVVAGLPVDPVDPQHQLVLWMIRWPRALLAGLVGASLALCGAAMQGLFRNPLADPSLIGVSSGASLGASLAIVLGASAFSGIGFVDADYVQLMGTYSVSIFACVGGFVTTLIVYKLGSSSHGTSVTTMLLAGIAISALAAAATNIFSYIADDVALRRISLWSMGNLGDANWSRVLVSITLLGAVLVALPRYGKVLNIFLLGESEARYLGVNVQKIKLQLIAWTALGVGVAVSVAGIIGFVGLVVPHLVRLIIGPDHRYLMPASALLGAVLLVMADWLSRLPFSPAEIPVGIVTALLGAPFFISLLLKQKQRLALQ